MSYATTSRRIPVFAALAAIACTAALARPRPLAIQPSQAITSPVPATYQNLGYDSLAIDGDWALMTANSPSGVDWQYDNQALLYRYVNGQWIFDRLLVSDLIGSYNDYTWPFVAMSNGLAAVSFHPLHMYRRSGATWTEIAHPFTAGNGSRERIDGPLQWDGSTLAALVGRCWSNPDYWGALYATHNPADDSWTTPVYVSANDTCDLMPSLIAKSGNTLAVSGFTNDFEEEPDQVRVFRNGAGGWQQVFKVPSSGEAVAARDPEVFVAQWYDEGIEVHRSDSTLGVIDRLVTPDTGASIYPAVRIAVTATHVFAINKGRVDVFGKNTDGKYEHVAALLGNAQWSPGWTLAVNGRRVLVHAHSTDNSSNTAVLAYELPVDLATPPLQQHTFESGNANGWTPTAGSQFSVVQQYGNRFYRQTSLAGDARAVLDDSDWNDATITADIRPTGFNGSDRWVGLATRYANASNFYYVTLRSSGTIQLRRVLDGAITILATQPLAVTAGKKYRVTLQTVGATQQVYLDGRQVLSARDATLQRGRAALVSFRASVEFDNVIVQPSLKFTIYDFDIANCSIYDGPEWTLTGPGSWTCDSKGTNTRYLIQSSVAGDARAISGTSTDDQVTQARARATAFAAPTGSQERWFGLATRYRDPANFYYLSVRSSNQVSLRRVVNGSITVLGSTALNVAPGTWYRLRLEAVGAELRAYVNDNLVLQARDTALPTGKSGAVTFKTSAEYTGFRTWQP